MSKYMSRNLANTIRRLATNTYTFTRTGAGGYGTAALPATLPASDDGRYVFGTTSTLTFVGSIQPTQGRDLLLLPEGLRTQQIVAVYTGTRMQTANAPNGVSGDVVQYGSDTYEIVTAQDWSESGKFYKYLAMKVGQ